MCFWYYLSRGSIMCSWTVKSQLASFRFWTLPICLCLKIQIGVICDLLPSEPNRSELILIHVLGYTSGNESRILKAVSCYRSCLKGFLHLGLSTYGMPVYRPYKNRFSFNMVGQNLTCCKNKGLILQILSTMLTELLVTLHLNVTPAKFVHVCWNMHTYHPKR